MRDVNLKSPVELEGIYYYLDHPDTCPSPEFRDAIKSAVYSKWSSQKVRSIFKRAKFDHDHKVSDTIISDLYSILTDIYSDLGAPLISYPQKTMLSRLISYLWVRHSLSCSPKEGKSKVGGETFHFWEDFVIFSGNLLSYNHLLMEIESLIEIETLVLTMTLTKDSKLPYVKKLIIAFDSDYIKFGSDVKKITKSIRLYGVGKHLMRQHGYDELIKVKDEFPSSEMLKELDMLDPKDICVITKAHKMFGYAEVDTIESAFSLFEAQARVVKYNHDFINQIRDSLKDYLYSRPNLRMNLKTVKFIDPVFLLKDKACHPGITKRHYTLDYNYCRINKLVKPKLDGFNRYIISYMNNIKNDCSEIVNSFIEEGFTEDEKIIGFSIKEKEFKINNGRGFGNVPIRPKILQQLCDYNLREDFSSVFKDIIQVGVSPEEIDKLLGTIADSTTSGEYLILNMDFKDWANYFTVTNTLPICRVLDQLYDKPIIEKLYREMSDFKKQFNFKYHHNNGTDYYRGTKIANGFFQYLWTVITSSLIYFTIVNYYGMKTKMLSSGDNIVVLIHCPTVRNKIGFYYEIRSTLNHACTQHGNYIKENETWPGIYCFEFLQMTYLMSVRISHQYKISIKVLTTPTIKYRTILSVMSTTINQVMQLSPYINPIMTFILTRYYPLIIFTTTYGLNLTSSEWFKILLTPKSMGGLDFPCMDRILTKGYNDDLTSTLYMTKNHRVRGLIESLGSQKVGPGPMRLLSNRYTLNPKTSVIDINRHYEDLFADKLLETNIPNQTIRRTFELATKENYRLFSSSLSTMRPFSIQIAKMINDVSIFSVKSMICRKFSGTRTFKNALSNKIDTIDGLIRDYDFKVIQLIRSMCTKSKTRIEYQIIQIVRDKSQSSYHKSCGIRSIVWGNIQIDGQPTPFDSVVSVKMSDNLFGILSIKKVTHRLSHLTEKRFLSYHKGGKLLQGDSILEFEKTSQLISIINKIISMSFLSDKGLSTAYDQILSQYNLNTIKEYIPDSDMIEWSDDPRGITDSLSSYIHHYEFNISKAKANNPNNIIFMQHIKSYMLVLAKTNEVRDISIILKDETHFPTKDRAIGDHSMGITLMKFGSIDILDGCVLVESSNKNLNLRYPVYISQKYDIPLIDSHQVEQALLNKEVCSTSMDLELYNSRKNLLSGQLSLIGHNVVISIKDLTTVLEQPGLIKYVDSMVYSRDPTKRVKTFYECRAKLVKLKIPNTVLNLKLKVTLQLMAFTKSHSELYKACCIGPTYSNINLPKSLFKNIVYKPHNNIQYSISFAENIIVDTEEMVDCADPLDFNIKDVLMFINCYFGKSLKNTLSLYASDNDKTVDEINMIIRGIYSTPIEMNKLSLLQKTFYDVGMKLTNLGCITQDLYRLLYHSYN